MFRFLSSVTFYFGANHSLLYTSYFKTQNVFRSTLKYYSKFDLSLWWFMFEPQYNIILSYNTYLITTYFILISTVKDKEFICKYYGVFSKFTGEGVQSLCVTVINSTVPTTIGVLLSKIWWPILIKSLNEQRTRKRKKIT